MVRLSQLIRELDQLMKDVPVDPAIGECGDTAKECLDLATRLDTRVSVCLVIMELFRDIQAPRSNCSLVWTLCLQHSGRV